MKEPSALPRALNSSRARPRWARFSLRTLLVVVGVGSIALGAFVDRKHREHEAVLMIRRLGGHAEYYSDFASPPSGCEVVQTADGRTFLRMRRYCGIRDHKVWECRDPESLVETFKFMCFRLLGEKYLGYVGRVDFGTAEVADNELQLLRRLPGLESVRINHPRFSKKQFRQLDAMPNLKHVNIECHEWRGVTAEDAEQLLANVRVHGYDG